MFFNLINMLTLILFYSQSPLYARAAKQRRAVMFILVR